MLLDSSLTHIVSGSARLLLARVVYPTGYQAPALCEGAGVRRWTKHYRCALVASRLCSPLLLPSTPEAATGSAELPLRASQLGEGEVSRRFGPLPAVSRCLESSDVQSGVIA